MTVLTLNLDERTATGKRVAQLRETGMVPSVIYGGKDQPISAQSAEVETMKLVHAAGKHTPVHLTIGGKKKLAMIKTIDMHPYKRTLRHVAFHAVKQNETITAEIPLVLTAMGESEAEKQGLVILQAIEKVQVKAKPGDLPEALELTVTDLATADDKIMMSDVVLPKGVEFADNEQDMDLVVANVYEPGALQAANDAAGGDATDENDPAVEAENATTEAEQPKA